MIEKLREYSALVRVRREELGLTCADLCVKAGISSKTLSLIENEHWPKNGVLSEHQKRGQGKCIIGLATALGFDPEEWIEVLGLPRYNRSIQSHLLLGKDDLEYLLKIVEITGPLKLSTANDLLSQRKSLVQAPVKK